jgi:FkbM family methyltransferase
MGIYNYTSGSLSGENYLIKNVVNNLGNDLVIFDVGANVGTYSKYLINSGVRIQRIFAFEPHPATFERLKENIQKIDGVVPVQSALSNQQGEMKLFDRAGYESTQHASFSDEIFSVVHKSEITQRVVKVDTIDLFCAINNIKTIDFLKIDVEGYELNVLQGALGMLTAKKVRLIQFEFTQLNSTVGVFFKEIYDLLSNDYHIYRLLPHGLQKIDSYNPTTCEIFGYQNFSAILKAEMLR